MPCCVLHLCMLLSLASRSNLEWATRVRPLRPFFLVLYLGLSVLAAVAGYLMHPMLLKLTAEIFGIKPSVSI